ncbi:MAG: class I SAM-dependent methyltransferase [Pseudomonadota bacterium]
MRRLAGDFMLGRACGLKRGVTLSIVDATAGLGVDAMALALRGQRLTLIERQPQLWALLVDLKARLGLTEVTLRRLDHRTALTAQEPVDVIYFDPMFPQRRKGALPGKAMQYLAALVDDDGEFDENLINLARERARQRVVLKRRARDPALLSPDWSIRGRSVRYDVYRGSASESGASLL